MAMKKDEWLDISTETYREYVYPNNTVRINSPKLLRITNSSLGGHAHRVQTEDGFAFYIAPGWNAIRWQVKTGQPLFSF